jgi:protein-L-isoaspartate O-methyltransferase
MLIPIGDDSAQRLLLVERRDEEWTETEIESARFVPLVGEEGW